MIKNSISLISIFILSIQVFAQSPFNYGQNEDMYFIAAKDLKYYNINVVHEFKVLKDGKSPNNYIQVCELDFLKDDNSFEYRILSKIDTIIPKTLEKALDIVQHNNGVDWTFKKDRATYIGGHRIGGGSCWSNFEIDSLFSLVEYYCQGNRYTEYYHLYFDAQGLPIYSICCVEKYDENEELEVSENLNDTTFFLYDDRLLFYGIVNNMDTVKVIEDIISQGVNHFTSDLELYQLYIDDNNFEKVIENKLGCKPRVIFMEVNKNVVLTFKYSETWNRYYSLKYISLESYSHLDNL